MCHRARNIGRRFPSRPRAGVSRASSASKASMRPSSMRASSSAMRSGSTTLHWWRSPRRVLAPKEADAIAALAARRLAHEPVARILGCKEFWGLPFKLNADTLLPRPETETVVEAALAALDGEHRQLARAAHRRSRHRLGRAAAGTALGAAERFRDRHGYQRHRARLRARQCRRARPCCPCVVRGLRLWRQRFSGPFDVVVSNPPYVARGEIAGLQPEVRDYDPRRALDGGPDGLDGYRAIAAHAPRLLAPNGVLAVELGRGQVSAVTAIFAAAGLAPRAPRHDLAGIARALVLRALP